MENIFYMSKDGKNRIHACVWRPEGEIRGVLQIIHGMSEYAERYAPFAQFLNAAGIAVCAEDHLGHGQSAAEADALGRFDDNHDFNTVLSDIRTLHLKMKEEAEGLPYFIMGHSMGSFFCRIYISKFGNELSGSIIMGTGFMSGALLSTALALTRLNALFCGWENRSKFIKSLAFGSYNKKFKADNDKNSWLSRDKENVKKYNSDSLCGFDFTDNGYYVLFSAIKEACSKKTINAAPKDFPVLFVSGKDDPVGNYGKGVIKTFDKFKAAKVKQVECKLYEGARHEILNDFCKSSAQEDILSFIEKNLKV